MAINDDHCMIREANLACFRIRTRVLEIPRASGGRHGHTRRDKCVINTTMLPSIAISRSSFPAGCCKSREAVTTIGVRVSDGRVKIPSDHDGPFLQSRRSLVQPLPGIPLPRPIGSFERRHTKAKHINTGIVPNVSCVTRNRSVNTRWNLLARPVPFTACNEKLILTDDALCQRNSPKVLCSE
jgi:hypothetical protein